MKKILAIVLALTMVMSFAACGKSSSSAAPSSSEPAQKEAVSLKVWGSQEDQEMLQGMVDSFKAAHPDKEYTIELAVVGESDARARYLEDPAAAADVFAFAHDQLADLAAAGALYELSGAYKDTVIAENVAASVEASTIDGKLYAFPMTADNGYFLYYDKSVLTEEDVKTLDGLLAKANASGKQFLFDMSNGWYIASFFFGAGCSMTVEDGKSVCDFNNANGLAAAEAIKAMTADPAFITGDDNVIKGGMGTTICAAVSGTWNSSALKDVLGENLAATKLPTATIGGEQKQLGSFAGYKLIGVSKVTKSPVDAMELAAWLTNYDNQVIRYTTRGMGPSNTKAAQADAVKADVSLAAIQAQSPYAVTQNNVPNNFWSPAEAFGALMEAKDYSSSLQEQIDAMVAQIIA